MWITPWTNVQKGPVNKENLQNDHFLFLIHQNIYDWLAHGEKKDQNKGGQQWQNQSVCQTSSEN